MIPQTMLAAVCTGYGGPERVVVAERPVPVPKDNEMLVKVAATTVNSGDVRIRGLNLPKGFGLVARPMFGFTKPRQPILGTELSGTVVAVGRAVTRFKEGDAVIAFPGLGTHQQYRAIPEDKPVVPKPESLSFEQAAALCFGGTTALDFFRKADLKPGEEVLVIGASGTVGSAMVQLARHLGARVTAAASAANRELVAGLGAHTVIDYRETDYTRQAAAYDVIADTVGASSFAKCFEALRPGGRYLALTGGLTDIIGSSRGGKRKIAGVAAERREDVETLAELAAQGVFTPLIDRTYPLAEIAGAHAYVDTGHKRGSVVITMP